MGRVPSARSRLAKPATSRFFAAIANAIADAIGVRVTELPLTADKVLKAIWRRDKLQSGAPSLRPQQLLGPCDGIVGQRRALARPGSAAPWHRAPFFADMPSTDDTEIEAIAKHLGHHEHIGIGLEARGNRPHHFVLTLNTSTSSSTATANFT